MSQTKVQQEKPATKLSQVSKNSKSDNYYLAEETLGYVTNPDPTNVDFRLLIGGSQNVLINYQKKTSSRSGYTRLGVANPALNNIRSAWTWNNSTGGQIPQRVHDTTLEAYIQIVDGLAINAWKTVSATMSASALVRSNTSENGGGAFFDPVELIDIELMVQHDQNIYEWSGGMAVVATAAASLSIFEAGDNSQLASWSLTGVTTLNSNNGILYWKLTSSGGTRTVNVYKDSAGSSLVASGSHSGDGSITLAQQNSSGISGSVVVTYTSDLTSIATQTLTVGYAITKAASTTYAQNRFYEGRGLSFFNSRTNASYKYYGAPIITTTGDVDLQLSNWAINGATPLNTNNYVLYWYLVDTTGTRNVNLYKDAAGTQQVASGSHVGDGVIVLSEEFNSGISGTVTVVYSANMTSISAQTLILSGGVATETLYVLGSAPLDLQANDLMIQSIITNTGVPQVGYVNDFIYTWQNQTIIGSASDNRVFASNDTSFVDFSFTAGGRIPGEGWVVFNNAPTTALSIIGKYFLIFSGLNQAYAIIYQPQIAVGTTIVETLLWTPISLGVNQGALNQECVIPMGNSLAYLSNEVALRIIQNPANLMNGINPKTFSNEIKPDFDAQVWTNACGMWYKNILFFTVPSASLMYMLNFSEDADGNLWRFWNPPQLFPIGPMSLIDTGGGKQIYGHSNAISESYLLFDGASDAQYSNMPTTDKIAIHAIATYAYANYGDAARLKIFDEYYVEGEITPNTTQLLLDINYDYQGSIQQIEKTIDGSNSAFIEGVIPGNPLGQNPLGQNPLGGLLNPPATAQKFRVMFEIAHEDFFEINATFSTNDIDQYWSILRQGANATLSPRLATNIRT